MKKKGIALIVAVVMLVAVLAIGTAGCGSREDTPISYTVTFDLNYPDAPANTESSVESGKTVAEPAAPVRDGWLFDGWYTTEDADEGTEYVFTTAVTGDITLYAKWVQNSVTVVFDENYYEAEDDTDTVYLEKTATKGGTVDRPPDPERENYEFAGWFSDANGTVAYDFDEPVTTDLTLYAKWTPVATEGYFIYSYYLNYGDQTGPYRQELVIKGFRATQPTAPSRDGYYFGGWYTDSECTDRYNFIATVSKSDLSLYAKWLKGYTFEAEYTYLTGKPGQGMSDNVTGTQLIMSADDFENGEEMGVSNGFLISRLLYRGAFLDFEITVQESVDDAVLVFRLTPDMYDMILSDTDLQFLVKSEGDEDFVALGPQDGYNGLELTGAYGTTPGTPNGEQNKRPFENYTITTSLTLEAGHNTIRLYVNNNYGHSGTYQAECPLVDCMYIYADTEVTWYEYYPENIQGK